MTYQPVDISHAQESLPKIPAWLPSGPVVSPAALAFRSGVVLTVLDELVAKTTHGVPVPLLANRLALRAAVACSGLEGRLARQADIRDAYHFTPADNPRGPDGDLLAFWRDAARLRLGGRAWQAPLQEMVGPGLEDVVIDWITEAGHQAKTGAPLAACVTVMRKLLQLDDRAERFACLLSDVVLARALGWNTALPISVQRLSKTMLRALSEDDQNAEITLQAALLSALEDTIHLARDSADRARALRYVAPKLRAKGSQAAVAKFLCEDAVGPSSTLSPIIQGTNTPMTDRAARRFCDRLVELGVASELTGRASFRLYGIAP